MLSHRPKPPNKIHVVMVLDSFELESCELEK